MSRPSTPRMIATSGPGGCVPLFQSALNTSARGGSAGLSGRRGGVGAALSTSGVLAPTPRTDRPPLPTTTSATPSAIAAGKPSLLADTLTAARAQSAAAARSESAQRLHR